jgi:hypothetical protein
VRRDQITRGLAQRDRQHTGDDSQQPLANGDVGTSLGRFVQPPVERRQQRADEVLRIDDVLHGATLEVGHRHAVANAQVVFDVVVGPPRSSRDQGVDQRTGRIPGQRGAMLGELSTVLEQPAEDAGQ